jgi:hypothetical protein
MCIDYEDWKEASGAYDEEEGDGEVPYLPSNTNALHRGQEAILQSPSRGRNQGDDQQING